MTDDKPEPTAEDDVYEVTIEDVLDLHGFQPRDIPSVVREYLQAAHAKGYRQVRLIHGRGTGWQRKRVRETLAGHPLVHAVSDAPTWLGGWGATLVELVQSDA